MPVITKTNATAKVLSALRGLTHKEALVGIPAENAGRDPEPGETTALNNAEIGYVHEFGSTIETESGGEIVIPPRPHLRPGIASVKEKIADTLGTGVRKTLAGDADAAEQSLEKAGMVGQNGVRKYITDGDFTPLAPATIANRKRRGRTGTKPLIDTGTYRRSITYVVRKKGED